MSRSTAPKVRHHFELLAKELNEEGQPIGGDKYKCAYCKSIFKSWNDTHMRVHLSDRDGVKMNNSIASLCTMVPPNVSKEFIEYFSQKRKNKAMSESVATVRLQSEAFEAGVDMALVNGQNKRKQVSYISKIDKVDN